MKQEAGTKFVKLRHNRFQIFKQNVDGSWGDEDREWNAFLVVHALKNKACL